MTMDQREMIANFNRDNRKPFNEDIFIRDDNDIIEELKKVILSVQRDSFFKIKVESFEIVEDYAEIQRLLYNYDELYKNKNKNRRKENQYSFINLKDSDIKLMIVTYYIAIQGNEDRIKVYIAIPRVVDRYYLRINGNFYSAMFQIVDGSTYNNLTSNSKYSSVTMKTVFMPIRIYRYTEVMKVYKESSSTDLDVGKESVKCIYYRSRIFNKSLPTMKYILARYGLYQAMNELGIKDIFITRNEPSWPIDNMYIFKMANNNFLSVPKVLFDVDPMTQSLVHTIIKSIHKDVEYEDIFSDSFWIISLGGEFNNYSVDKGLSILTSLESIYDITTKESIRLPEQDKRNIYDILKWMMREFTHLRQKDNLDISIKKIRLAEYIASLYAMKISKGIYRISDLQKRANIDSIKKALITNPSFLLSAIGKCNLVNYRNMVNDLDALTAMKYTYKGVSGLGENNSNSIPDIYRSVNISHIGRVDMDSSSNSDPGITGVICPYTKLYDGSFSDYQEPDFWEAEYDQTVKDLRKAIGLKEVAEFEKKILGVEDETVKEMTEVVGALEQLIKPACFVSRALEEDNKIYLEEGGVIYYED